MGTDIRSKKSSKEIPGPGQYNSLSFIGKAPKYSISGRNELDTSKNAISPGPGNYSPKYNSLYKSYSYSMSSKPNTSKPILTPGPGNYNVRTEKLLQVPSYK
jgi:hypothetical protein